MNTLLEQSTDRFVQANISELVKGSERSLVDRLAPLVRTGNVTLDCTRVERIDAAGIAALICLYGSARDNGNHFHIANPSAHVREVLAIVGLDRILAVQDAAEACFVCTAA